MRISLVGDIWALPGVRIETEALFDNDTLVLGNLETPVAGSEAVASRKAGPSIRGDREGLCDIAQQIPGLTLSLANNHIMDFGREGLESTIELLKDQRILFCGAGVNEESAGAPLFITHGGRDLCILTMGEVQFGKVQGLNPGYHTISPDIYQKIRDLKKRSGFLILSVHGASEMSPVPSPLWLELLRSFIDCGVDLVHGHHAHVPQGYEKYKHGFIFYGLGNFIADPERWPSSKLTTWSIIPRIEFNNGKMEVHVETAVIERIKSGILVREAEKVERTRHISYLEKCNEVIADRMLLQGVWQELSINLYKKYYAGYLGFEKTGTPVTRGMRQRISILKRAIYTFMSGREKRVSGEVSSDKFLLWYHLFACDSHKYAIETALGVLGGELEDLTGEASEQTLRTLTTFQD